MKRNSLLICLFAALFLSSCGGRSKTASALANGDTIPLRLSLIHIYGVPVTKELVIALNPKRNEWEEIKAGLDKIGYPNEL